MEENQDFLNEYASSKSKYFSLAEEEEKEIKFLYAEKVPNHFDGGKTQLIRYHLEVDGKELLWDRVSGQLAREIAKVSKGDTITIKRTGQKNQTKYSVRKVEE